jgi:hypothetical protein
VFDVLTVTPEATPETDLVSVGKTGVPVQLADGYSVNDTVPARFPPADAEIVAESFGTHLCAVVIDDGTLVTVTSSSVSVQAALCVTVSVFGELPL